MQRELSSGRGKIEEEKATRKTKLEQRKTRHSLAERKSRNGRGGKGEEGEDWALSVSPLSTNVFSDQSEQTSIDGGWATAAKSPRKEEKEKRRRRRIVTYCLFLLCENEDCGDGLNEGANSKKNSFLFAIARSGRKVWRLSRGQVKVLEIARGAVFPSLMSNFWVAKNNEQEFRKSSCISINRA